MQESEGLDSCSEVGLRKKQFHLLKKRELVPSGPCFFGSVFLEGEGGVHNESKNLGIQ